MNRIVIHILAIFTLCLSINANAPGAIVDWIGGFGLWDQPLNWSNEGIPGFGDTARFAAGGNYGITVNSLRSVGGIDWSDVGAVLSITPGPSGGNGQLIVNSDLTINGVLNFDNNAALSNKATTLLRDGTITNAATGIINMIGTATGTRALQANQFLNNGTVNVDRPALFAQTDGVFTNNASVSVASGSVLAFGTNNTFNQNAGTFDNQGEFLFDNDVLNFNGGNFTGNPIDVHRSTLNNNTTGSGVFNLRGAVTYSGDVDSNQVLNLQGSTIVTTSADFVNRSTINFDHNGANNVPVAMLRDGTITNAATGIINMIGTATGTRALQANQFLNNGTVNVDRPALLNRTDGVFTNNASVSVASGSVLAFGTNNTFNQNAGTFDNQGDFLFDNDVLNFNGGNFTGNPIDVHRSTLNNNTTGSGVFNLRGAVTYSGDVDSNQVLNLQGSTIVTTSADFVNRSTINFDHNSANNVSVAMLRDGTITNAATGIINMIGTATGTRALQANQFLNNGTVNVDRPALFAQTDGVFTNNASVSVASGSVLAFGTNNTFNQNAGTFDNQGDFLFDNDVLNFNGGNFTGNPIDVHRSTLNNNTTGSGVFNLRGAVTYSGDVDSNQVLNLQGSTIVTTSADFVNRGTINFDHNSANNVSAAMLRDGTITNAATGIINMIGTANGTRALLANQFLNNGTVNVDRPALFNQPSGVYSNSGTININSSQLTIGNSSTLENLAGGSLRGVGTLNVGSNGLQNDGIITPGFSAGALTFDGDVAFGPTADLRIELGGTTQATEYDLLNALDALDLDGSLSVSFLGGFENSVAPTDQFTIVSAGTLIGTFAGLADGDRVATTGAPGTFQINYSGNDVILSSFQALLSGDYDGNGLVGAGDLNLVLANWGTDGSTAPIGWVNHLPVDTISAGELNGVLNNWGSSLAVVVPEPHLPLALLVFVAFARRRR